MKKQFLNYLLLFISTIFIINSCSEPTARDIEYNQDQCNLCQMKVTDQRYGAELITKKGKLYFYDSVECLGNEINKESFKSEDIHSLWVTDYTAPKKLIDAKKSYYLHSEKMPSPMGMFLTAFADKATAEKFQQKNGGELMNWTELLEYLKNNKMMM